MTPARARERIERELEAAIANEATESSVEANPIPAKESRSRETATNCSPPEDFEEEDQIDQPEKSADWLQAIVLILFAFYTQLFERQSIRNRSIDPLMLESSSNATSCAVTDTESKAEEQSSGSVTARHARGRSP